jgi:hypothetical protein
MITVLYRRSDGRNAMLHKESRLRYAEEMSTIEEIEAAIPKLSRPEVEALREWIDDFLEDQLDLSDEVKKKLDQSRAEIAEGKFTTRRPGK